MCPKAIQLQASTRRRRKHRRGAESLKCVVWACVCLPPSRSRWPHTPLWLRWVSLDPARPKSRCPCSASPSTPHSLWNNREQGVNRRRTRRGKSATRCENVMKRGRNGGLKERDKETNYGAIMRRAVSRACRVILLTRGVSYMCDCNILRWHVWHVTPACVRRAKPTISYRSTSVCGLGECLCPCSPVHVSTQSRAARVTCGALNEVNNILHPFHLSPSPHYT